MGGLIHGGETSALIKERLPGLVAKALAAAVGALPEGEGSLPEAGNTLTPERAALALAEQTRLLNEEIFSLGQDSNARDFGATLTGVWFIGQHAVFVNIGDSRGYIFNSGNSGHDGHDVNKGALRQITKDHTLAAYLVASGELTAEEARGHSSSSRLLRYVGMRPPAKPETFIETVNPGLGILLCSDGLYGMLEDDEIARILSENGKTPARALVDAANARGGRDNISVVYIAAETDAGAEA
jgi:serine/threonine protein phosphatase PrpC